MAFINEAQKPWKKKITQSDWDKIFSPELTKSKTKRPKTLTDSVKSRLRKPE